MAVKMEDFSFDSDMCRACGNRGADIPLAVFEHTFKLCTALSVSDTDGMPENICQKCMKRLTVAYHFRIACQRTERKLRTFMAVMTRMQRPELDPYSLGEYGFQTDLLYDLAADENIGTPMIDDDELSESTPSVKAAQERFMEEEYLTSSGEPSFSGLLPNLDDLFQEEEEEISEELVTYDDIIYTDNSLTDSSASNKGNLSITVLTAHPDLPSGLTKTPVRKTRFRCDECCKDFTTKTNLERHRSAHNGNKPFQCDICLKGFTQSGSMKTHRYTHFNIKPFSCDICKQRFTQRKSLTFHIRRHTGEKPFACDVCDTTFRQKSGLVRHQRKHRNNPNQMFPKCAARHQVRKIPEDGKRNPVGRSEQIEIVKESLHQKLIVAKKRAIQSKV